MHEIVKSEIGHVKYNLGNIQGSEADNVATNQV
jgi:hypothetical protein